MKLSTLLEAKYQDSPAIVVFEIEDEYDYDDRITKTVGPFASKREAERFLEQYAEVQKRDDIAVHDYYVDTIDDFDSPDEFFRYLTQGD